MDVNLRLELQQKTIMTPELQQAIAILQLTAMELTALIEKELVDNPVLETMEPDSDTADNAGQRLVQYVSSQDYKAGDGEGGTENVDAKNRLDGPTEPISLLQYLEFQLNLALTSGREHSVGRYLIGCLDDNGYLTQSSADVAKALGMTPNQVVQVLNVIQSFDPPGVGARNLQECLLVQLHQLGVFAGTAVTIIEKYLDDVAVGRFKYIAEQINCPVQEVGRAVDFIRGLNPKPGSNFVSPGRPNGYVTADVTVKQLDNKFVIILENQYPRLTISRYYSRLLTEGESETQKYLQTKIHAAAWLIRSIEQRNRTLHNVTQAIIDLQPGFFSCGLGQLRPLTLKDIASRVGIHESTVSRAVANKYIDTPFGLYSFKKFFSAALFGVNGEVSTTQIKRKVKELIAAEDITSPLSDQQVADRLKTDGISIARRTVAKYREEQHILSAKSRKRL